MNSGIIDPRKVNEKELDCVDKFAATALGVVLNRIEQLSKEDRDDMFEAFLSLKKDSSSENRDAVQATFEEILGQTEIKIVEEEIGVAAQSSNWSDFVSRKLLELRKQAGMTQKDVAEAAKMQQSHICRIERREISPSQKTIKRLAIALGVSVCVFDPSAS